MRCSASNMFAMANLNYCKCVTRKAIYSIITSNNKSLNVKMSGSFRRLGESITQFLLDFSFTALDILSKI